MLAIQLTEWGRAPELRDVPVPDPVGKELLIEVGAASLCRSDLHVMDSPEGRFDYPLPLTLGHEVAGTVVAGGPQANQSWIGQSVVVYGIWSCRRCRNCRRGQENYCLNLNPRNGGRLAPIGNGLGYPGGLAEAMLVPSSDVLVSAKSLGHAEAAPLADAGLTAYHTIRTNAEIIDSRTVAVVVGVGGLGHLAIQILHYYGVETIVAVETRSEALNLASKLGVTAGFSSFAEAAPMISELHGADVVFDFVGAPETVGRAAETLAPGGRIVMVGGAGGRLTVGKDVGLSNGWQVKAPFWGSLADLQDVIDLAAAGHLHAEASTYPLEDGVEVYRKLRCGAISGRAVLVPPGCGHRKNVENSTGRRQ